jgi:hypothetical protein
MEKALETVETDKWQSFASLDRVIILHHHLAMIIPSAGKKARKKESECSPLS